MNHKLSLRLKIQITRQLALMGAKLNRMSMDRDCYNGRPVYTAWGGSEYVPIKEVCNLYALARKTARQIAYFRDRGFQGR